MPSIELGIDSDPLPDRWVQILDVDEGGRVVTVIELLRPRDKAKGPANDRYLRKLANYRKGGVNVVEIDLLREPHRSYIIFHPDNLPARLRSPYLVSVYRATRPTKLSIYPLPLRNRLGNVPIPLRKTDSDAVLNLQSLIDATYEEGGYGTFLDYSKPPSPLLSEDDARWAQTLDRPAR
jgi:hypothetical protein